MRKLVQLLTLALIVGTVASTPAVAGGGAHCDQSITDMETDVVRLSMNCFQPTITRVEPGTEVRFVNEDPVPHTVTGAIFTFGNLDELGKGDESTFRFEDEGIYPYYCVIHPGMAGAIVVGDGKGPGAGVVSDVSSYRANGSEQAADEAATSAFTDTESASLWPNVVAALIALAILGALSIRFRRRVSASISMTTKP